MCVCVCVDKKRLLRRVCSRVFVRKKTTPITRNPQATTRIAQSPPQPATHRQPPESRNPPATRRQPPESRNRPRNPQPTGNHPNRAIAPATRNPQATTRIAQSPPQPATHRQPPESRNRPRNPQPTGNHPNRAIAPATRNPQATTRIAESPRARDSQAPTRIAERRDTAPPTHMLYYANDLIVSKTGKFYRIIERDPTRSTRQRTLYRVRRLSDGREMKRAYQPFTDFWRAPQEAEAALDAGDVAGATRAALAIGYPVDAAAAAEDADEVEVEAIVVEVEANDDAPPPPRVGYTLGKQQRAERARAQVRLHPPAPGIAPHPTGNHPNHGVASLPQANPTESTASPSASAVAPPSPIGVAPQPTGNHPNHCVLPGAQP